MNPRANQALDQKPVGCFSSRVDGGRGGLTSKKHSSWVIAVQYQGSRYSVPPEHVGAKVAVLAAGGSISIRVGEVLGAEHGPAPKPRSCVIAPAHLQAMWQRTVSKATAERHAPPPRCEVNRTSQPKHGEDQRAKR